MAARRIGIDHVTVGVSNLERSTKFYLAALAPLGFDHLNRSDVLPHEVEFGDQSGHPFAISTDYSVGAPVHLAFAAAGREQVDAFHAAALAAALAAGGRDHGAPGPRPEYSAGYYGAFVLDPDGHNVEAVFHDRGAAG